MKRLRSRLAILMALCLMLTAACALADRTLEGDANVDQRFYPATTPFIHPPFYNVRLTVEVDDNGVITAVKDNGTGGPGSSRRATRNFGPRRTSPSLTPP